MNAREKQNTGHGIREWGLQRLQMNSSKYNNYKKKDKSNDIISVGQQ